jgi:molecular chaperone GrpE (heat shock protein)
MDDDKKRKRAERNKRYQKNKKLQVENLHKENEKLERLKKENEELTDKIKRLEHDNGGLLRTRTAC